MPVSPDDEDEQTVEIMPSAWTSLSAFLACQTQWRVGIGMSAMLWLGLDYGAVKLVLDDLDAPRGTFTDLRLMEAAALPVLNEVIS